MKQVTLCHITYDFLMGCRSSDISQLTSKEVFSIPLFSDWWLLCACTGTALFLSRFYYAGESMGDIAALLRGSKDTM